MGDKRRRVMMPCHEYILRKLMKNGTDDEWRKFFGHLCLKLSEDGRPFETIMNIVTDPAIFDKAHQIEVGNGDDARSYVMRLMGSVSERNCSAYLLKYGAVKDLCDICPLSKTYKNKNMDSEWVLLSLVYQHPELRESLISHVGTKRAASKYFQSLLLNPFFNETDDSCGLVLYGVAYAAYKLLTLDKSFDAKSIAGAIFHKPVSDKVYTFYIAEIQSLLESCIAKNPLAKLNVTLDSVDSGAGNIRSKMVTGQMTFNLDEPVVTQPKIEQTSDTNSPDVDTEIYSMLNELGIKIESNGADTTTPARKPSDAPPRRDTKKRDVVPKKKEPLESSDTGPLSEESNDLELPTDAEPKREVPEPVNDDIEPKASEESTTDNFEEDECPDWGVKEDSASEHINNEEARQGDVDTENSTEQVYDNTTQAGAKIQQYCNFKDTMYYFEPEDYEGSIKMALDGADLRVIENTILNEMVLYIEYVEYEADQYWLIYLPSVKLMYALPLYYMDGVRMLEPMFRRSAMPIVCFSPYELCYSIIARGMTIKNVCSIETFYKLENRMRKRVSPMDVIKYMSGVENRYLKPFFMYAMPRYAEILNRINESGNLRKEYLKECQLELFYSASWRLECVTDSEDRLFETTGDWSRNFKFDIRNELNGYKRMNVSCVFKGMDTVFSEKLIDDIFIRYVDKGCMKKCVAHIVYRSSGTFVLAYINWQERYIYSVLCSLFRSVMRQYPECKASIVIGVENDIYEQESE